MCSEGGGYMHLRELPGGVGVLLYGHLREVMCTVAHLSLGSYSTIAIFFSKFSQLGNRIMKKLLYFFYDSTTVHTV